MDIDFISDIHLEFSQQQPKITNPTSKFLALLGDIGKPRMENYDRFIKSVTSQYEHVFVIAGNHEYYSANYTYDKTTEFMEKYFDKLPNCSFLNNSSYIHNNIKIIGCTLWTYITNNRHFIENNMNDYFKIKLKNKIKKPITISDTNKWHLLSKYYLEEELEDSRKNDFTNVILTHHVPVGTPNVIPIKYQQEPYNRYNSAYHANCEDIIDKYKIDAWLFGHCHTKISTSLGSCKLLSNPVGYPSENGNNHNLSVCTLSI